MVQNEVGGCTGPGPRRLLPRRERLRVQATLRYKYRARLLSLREVPASMRCHQGGYSRSYPQLISEHHHKPWKLGKKKLGEVLRRYSNCGMAKELRRSNRASWVETCWGLSPIVRSSCVFPEIASEVELISPMGELNRKADAGSVVCASGIESSMDSLAARPSPITSDFRSFRCRPKAVPSQTITSRSYLTSSAGPPMVLSSRYQTQSCDFS